jgi:rSAM/selenodomain-associated transferase 1
MIAADPGTAVIVFAKAPRPGSVKTRLVPLLGAEGAAALQVRLVKHALETATKALRPVELHCAPDANDPFFRFCAGHYGVTVRAQVEGDLGARMLTAFTQSLPEHACVLLIGSDCPALTARHLRQADRSLRDGADAVFIPCEDGGYALIGMKRVEAALFDGMTWGGEHVMADTRARLTALGWRWRELETLWDVDRPEDHARLMDSGLLRSSSVATEIR